VPARCFDVALAARDYQASLKDIAPPPPRITSSNPEKRRQLEYEEVRRQIHEEQARVLEKGIPARSLTVPPPAVAAELQQREVNPRRFGRLSASAVRATTLPEALPHSPRSPRAFSAHPARREVEAAEVQVQSPRRTSAPATRFGRVSIAAPALAQSLPESTRDDSAHYEQYTEFNQLQIAQQQRAEVHSASREGGPRITSAPVHNTNVPQSGWERESAHSAPNARTAADVTAAVATQSQEGVAAHAEGGDNQTSIEKARNDGKKSSGSGFFSALFGFMGGGARKDSVLGSASDVVRGRSGATNCNSLQCNIPQHTATHCNPLPHAATRCNTLQHAATCCNTLQHTATHGNTWQNTATHGNTLQHTAQGAVPGSAFDVVCWC